MERGAAKFGSNARKLFRQKVEDFKFRQEFRHSGIIVGKGVKNWGDGGAFFLGESIFFFNLDREEMFNFILCLNGFFLFVDLYRKTFLKNVFSVDLIHEKKKPLLIPTWKQATLTTYLALYAILRSVQEILNGSSHCWG